MLILYVELRLENPTMYPDLDNISEGVFLLGLRVLA
jgi:hypothetical protein